MKVQRIDKEKSHQMFQEFQSEINSQACYDNVYSVSHLRDFQKDYGDWKIGFGYFGSTSFMVKRHAYFISPEGTIVDPTAFSYDHSTEFIEAQEYVTFKEMSKEEYLDYLGEDMNTSLKGSMKQDEKNLYRWLIENGVMLVAGPDYDEYLKEFDIERRIHPLFPQDMGF